MATFITTTDFSTGQYKLPLSINTNDVLSARIDYLERDVLLKLFGGVMYQKLLTYTKTEITSGTLTIGKLYTIETFVTGDDFSNVANVQIGSINTTGCTFIATGTTPTTWTHSSILIEDSALYVVQNPFWVLNNLSAFYVNEMFGDYNWGVNNNEAYNSNGIKDILKIAVYKDAIIKDQYKTSQSGLMKNGAENGNVASGFTAARMGERLWNTDAFNSWIAIMYLCNYLLPDYYPDYKGQFIKVEYSSII